MKCVLTLLALSALSFGSFAQADVVKLDANQLTRLQMSALQSDLSTLNLINWKVGDTASMDMSLGSFGKIGTMVKSVTKDEGQTLWLRQDANMMGQAQVADVQMDKSNGKILKLIVNGKEQAVPDGKIEVISQEYTEITVPAGKFKCVHVVAKSKDAAHIEVWANPRDTVMDGALKLIQSTQMGDIQMELTSFKRG